ncbi:MAG: nitronate monooxygenase [Bacteroidia bacterium]|nr:nitronate monooxygenase [Bacteroidia bacterium]
MQTSFTKMMGIEFPVIMAPMFLVSNTAMIIAALENGITAAFPALNYRTDAELRAAISEIKARSKKPFGVNLIVNKSNYKYHSQLATCVELNVDFIITSLGNPKEVIDKCKAKGIKVFCDVVDLKYAQKVEALGADGVIAVNNKAGGHAGDMPAEELVPLLKKNLRICVISAGGIASGTQLKQTLDLGADAVSIGTIFIASTESPVSQEYKNALVEYGAKDIVRTTKLSGTPCTVINTPYVQTLGTKEGFLERMLHKNKFLKKYAKLLLAIKGLKTLERSALGATYKTVWCAGPAIEYIHSIRPVKEIISQLTREYKEALNTP